MVAAVRGHVDPGYEAVRDAFADLLDSGAESGAGVAVIHRGRLVVDVVGGWRDAERSEPWTPETVVAVYSVSKPFAAACLLVLVDRGRIGLDDPVHRHWPEFPDDGTTVRHVLAHTAGRPGFDTPRPKEAYADWALLTADLAAATPLWTPGTTAAEHALTYGHLVGELVRRVDGRGIGRFFTEEIARPWSLEASFGAGEARVIADLVFGEPDWPVTSLGEPGSLRHRSLGNPAGCRDLDVLNGPLWRQTEVPAVNLHATARAVARFYAGLLAGGTFDGHRLMSADTVAEMVRVQHSGPDLLLGNDVDWTLGMQVDPDGTWGMGGIGGNVGYADPALDYAFAYVTHHLAGFERVDVLAEATIRAVQDV
jgi:CubicO group peptidase (beta-lactamase class C family)